MFDRTVSGSLRCLRKQVPYMRDFISGLLHPLPAQTSSRRMYVEGNAPAHTQGESSSEVRLNANPLATQFS
jgi:hypothetical protein